MAFETTPPAFRRHNQRNHESSHRETFRNRTNQSIATDHPSHRSSKSYNYNEPYEPAKDRSRASRPDGGHKKPIPRLPFEDAVHELVEVLAETLEFYSSFKRHFDEDVRHIRAYASPAILAELWNQKSSALGGHRREGRDERGHEPHSSPGRLTFKTAFLHLQDAFELVLRSSHDAPGGGRNGHDGGADRASLRRLVVKLQGAREDILKLARGAVKRVGDAEALVTELELMVAYLEKSRAVWRKERDGDGRSDARGGRRREERYAESHADELDRSYGQGDDDRHDRQMEDDGVDQGADGSYQEPAAEGEAEAGGWG